MCTDPCAGFGGKTSEEVLSSYKMAMRLTGRQFRELMGPNGDQHELLGGHKQVWSGSDTGKLPHIFTPPLLFFCRALHGAI